MKKLLSIVILSFILLLYSPKIFAAEDIDYEELFNNHQTVMMIIHPDSGIIYYANQAAADFYGYSLEDLMGMNINLINTLTPEEVAAERLKALEEERNFFVFRHRLANGDIRTVHVYSYPVAINGDTYLFSIIIDQTAYTIIQNRNRIIIILAISILIIATTLTTYLAFKRASKKRQVEIANEEIQKQNNRQDTLISNLPGVSYRCKNDERFTMTFISDNIYKLSGYTSQDFYDGMINYAQLIHPEDVKRVVSAFDREEQHKESLDLIYRIIDKFGNIKWVHEIAKQKNEINNLMLDDIEGFIQDITDKKLADAEALYHKDLLQYIISHSNQGIAVHDKDLNYVYVSERYCDMYNVSKNIIGKHHYDVFPDLPQKWREVHQRSLNGETLSGDRDEFIRMDGTVQYTRWMSQPWYDMSGKVAGIIIYTEVINDLIKTQLDLNKALDRLQLVMDNLTIGIAVNSVDPEVEFEYMNDKFPVFYGTTKEALMKSGSFWDAVYEDETFREEIKEKVLKGLASDDPKLKRWEYVPIQKNGKIVRYITAQGVNIPNSGLIISMVMDVTEQKHKEEEIIYTSKHDYLTGLPNRRYFEEKLLQMDCNDCYPLVIAMIDLDGLKLINDAYGHDSGDEVLVNISSLIKNNLRKNDFVARIGGDEFVLICPNTSTEEFEDLKNKITKNSQLQSYQDFKFSISIGYDVKRDETVETKDILKNAEDNMYANKILHGQSARNETIMTLFEALKEKYDEEKLHSSRVSEYCNMMGNHLDLSQDQIKELEFAGLMHDIGKITIPDRILDKPGKLTDEEWVIMKTHTINGYHILRSADKYSKLAEYALTHHERWDGKGYPNGLKGEDIPLFSRIISICDAYEAMTADRPYRKALDHQVAIDELKKCAGSQFDEKLVDIFVKAINENER